MRSLLVLPERARLRLLGPPTVVDGDVFDRQLELLVAMLAWTGRMPMDRLDVAAARADMDVSSAMMTVRKIRMESTSTMVVRGRSGTLEARLYRPAGLRGRATTVVYFHGGGFVIGSLDSHDHVCRRLAKLARAVVLSVAYRLAPEHKFPVATEDAHDALDWAIAHVEALGGDRKRVVVAGDSAGATLAAVACLSLRDAGRPLPAKQVLVYPGTDLTRSMRSHQTFARRFLLETPTLDWFIANYLDSPEQTTDPRASPLLASDFRGLPRAHVVTAAFDPLRDEGEAYVERLRAAGVPATCRRAPGMAHGFISMGDVISAARGEIARIAAELA